MSDSGGGGPTTAPPTNPLTKINKEITAYNQANNNVATPVGYYGALIFNNVQMSEYNANTSSSFALPNLNLTVTAVDVTFVNTSTTYYDLVFLNNQQQALYPNSTTVNLDSEALQTVTLTNAEYYINNQHLTFYYDVGGAAPTIGSLTMNIVIHYVIN